jgi:hypothetical protein
MIKVLTAVEYFQCEKIAQNMNKHDTCAGNFDSFFCPTGTDQTPIYCTYVNTGFATVHLHRCQAQLECEDIQCVL